MGWEEWSAQECMRDTFNKWEILVGLSGRIQAEIELLRQLTDETAQALSGKEMQEDVIHTMSQYANMCFHEERESEVPNEWTEGKITILANLTSQLAYMQQTDRSQWSKEDWVQWNEARSQS